MRVQRAALAIIKATIGGTPQLLLQLDNKASQYQLIGGRLKKNETPLNALIREIKEEIPETGLIYNNNYSLTPLNKEPITVITISPSVNMKTQYFFWIFFMEIKSTKFKPSPKINRWFPINDLLVRYDKFYAMLNMELSEKLEDLPNSISDTFLQT